MVSALSSGSSLVQEGNLRYLTRLAKMTEIKRESGKRFFHFFFECTLKDLLTANIVAFR